MIKAEMKQGIYDTEPAPRPRAVAAGPSTVAMTDQPCGPSNATAITDEFGRKYNCRGDRLH